MSVVLVGLEIHPHLLRFTFGYQYLAATGNDRVGEAQIFGHSNLNTTRRYVEQTEGQLGKKVERLNY